MESNNPQIIKEIVDKHLFSARLPVKIEPEMSDPDQNRNEEWQRWFPIDSTITDNEIIDLENEIGYALPSDYITFLKYKHFYEFNIGEAGFIANPIRLWNERIIDTIFYGYPKEYLIEQGYIPFADWSDWGHLCFDTNRSNQTKNYPIILWDNDRANEYKDFADNFIEMLILLDKAAEENKENIG